jgi:hypothetical protein
MTVNIFVQRLRLRPIGQVAGLPNGAITITLPPFAL